MPLSWALGPDRIPALRGWWAQCKPRLERHTAWRRGRTWQGPGEPPDTSSQQHLPNQPLPLYLCGPYPEESGIWSGKRHWKVKKNCAVHQSRLSREQDNQGELKHTENSSFLARCSGFRQEKVRRAWEKGLRWAEAGICSRSPRGTGLAPEPGNAEGCSPTGGGLPHQVCQAGEKRGATFCQHCS